MLKDFKDLLIAVDLVNDSKTKLGEMPDSPNDAVALFEYPMGKPNVAGLTEVGFQIRFRDLNYEACRERIWTIFGFLHGQRNLFINGNKYFLIDAIQAPSPMGGKDVKGRTEFVQNYRILLERS